MKTSFNFKIIIPFGTIIILFFIGELVIRINDVLSGYNFFSNEHRDKLVLRTNPVKPFRTFGPNFYTEKDGVIYISSSHGELFPLKKAENTFRIVCFGGSTTYNIWSYEKYGVHYPGELQKMLRVSYPNKNIEVINVGFDSYSTPHLLILLELDVICWAPDLVIVSENTNDLDVSYWAHFTFDYSNKYRSRFFVPNYDKEYTPLNALFRWSSFYWWLEYKYDEIKKSYFPSTKRFLTNRMSLGKEPAKLSQYVFRRNLLNFHHIANRWGIPILFATQPLNSNVESENYLPRDMGFEPNIIEPLLDEKILHHNFFNSIIIDVARSTDSYCIDNDSLLNGESKYFIDAVHYTKLGIEKLADNYFNYIISNNIIKNERVTNVQEFL